MEKYEREGIVTRVNGNQDIQAVFRDVLVGLRPVQEQEVLDAHRAAAAAASSGDWAAYAEVRLARVESAPVVFFHWLQPFRTVLATLQLFKRANNAKHTATVVLGAFIMARPFALVGFYLLGSVHLTVGFIYRKLNMSLEL